MIIGVKVLLAAARRGGKVIFSLGRIYAARRSLTAVEVIADARDRVGRRARPRGL